MKKFFKNIKPRVKWFLLIGGISSSLFYGALFERGSSYYFDDKSWLIESVFIGIPAYLLAMFMGLWIFQKFMRNYFKSINRGIQRSIIVGTIIGAPIIGYLLEKILEDEYNDKFFEETYWFAESIFIGIPVYWLLVSLSLWIYQGFNEENIKNT
ncbi:hypothetical protein [Oceanihabitans sediminis]|uniref:hypothetical protein n=1 Tax=Oceanihabitans sediminis TaxID=1812012 RepID=UPI00299E8110|nr:hypothetical protein [Oceanihabitans sediminis]MDX1774882.1 hypothetical protein [Oceanihabitans sediminis]